MAKHVFILEARSGSFLIISEAGPNSSDAYKRSVCSVCYKTVSIKKKLSLRK